ncbi:MAG: glycosyltransferase family 2 protein [Leptospirales bacterium]
MIPEVDSRPGPVSFTVCIITRNEEPNIGDCIDSLGDLPDEILVLDALSQDRTCEIARLKGAFVHQHPFDSFGVQKQRAVDLARNDWVFLLDADERMTKSLQNEIADLLAHPERVFRHSGYRVCRTNYFLKKRIRHGGWEKDFLIRFFDRSKASFDGKIVHEEVRTDGRIGLLKGNLDHFPVRTIEEFVQKNLRYANMKARTKQPITTVSAIGLMLFSPPLVFFRMYFLRLGFMDGLEGFVLASLYGFFAFMKALNRVVPGKEP